MIYLPSFPKPQAYDAGGGIYEYGDRSCPMGGTPNLARGYTLPHYNMPNSVVLRWTVPQAVLGARELPVGVWREFDLLGLADSRSSGLQVMPATWNATGWRGNDRLYVSFRHYSPRGGPDSNLLPVYRDTVQVHYWQPGTEWGGCAAPVLVAVLDGRSARSWPMRGSRLPQDVSSPGVAVRVSSSPSSPSSSSLTAHVGICRWGDGRGISAAGGIAGPCRCGSGA